MKKNKGKQILKSLQPQEIWLAKVYFEEKEEIRIRPVIIIDSLNETKELLIIALKATSQRARDIYGRKDAESIGPAEESEVPLVEWEAENLRKPSIVRASKVLLMPEKLFLRRLGRISDKDWRNVLKAYRKVIKSWGKDWKAELKRRNPPRWG